MNPPIERIDHYQWLRDETRENLEVLDHLKKENEYCTTQTLSLQPLKEELYNEMYWILPLQLYSFYRLSHLKETDEDVPYKDGNFFYYTRTVKGLSYKIHCRKISSEDTAEEEVILDENKLAEGKEYSDVSAVEPSPSHSLIAYSVDNTGLFP